jgi:hypothetical protein
MSDRPRTHPSGPAHTFWCVVLAGLVHTPSPAGGIEAPSELTPSLEDPALALVRAAQDLGYAAQTISTLAPMPRHEVDAVLQEAAGSLAGVPDGDGIEWSGAFAPLTNRVGLRGAHLFSQGPGGHRFADGDRLEEGLQVRGVTTLGFSLPSVTCASTARLEMSHETTRLRLPRAAVVVRGKGLRLTFGREPRWWGPGLLNEVLLTNNAEAGDGLEIATDGTQQLPWIGPVRASTIVLYFDDPSEPVPYPLLFGQRVVARPSAWIELGAERTVMLGGAGRTERMTWRDVGNVLLGRNENLVRYTGYRDTDQKVGFDATLYLSALAGRIPALRGGRLFYRYAGDDSFEGFLPTRVAHHYGGTFHFDRTSVSLEAFGNVASGLWYWNSEYPRGYRNGSAFLGTDLGWDSRSFRLRVLRTLHRDLGGRFELLLESRGHGFHDDGSLEPARGADPAESIEIGFALTRRLHTGGRATIEFRSRTPRGGFAFDDDDRQARHLVTVTYAGS